MTRVLLWIFSALVCLYLLLPAAVVIPLSFNSSPFLQFPPPGYTTKWYEQFFADPSWTGSLFMSFRVGSMSALLSIVLGATAAYFLLRAGRKTERYVDTALALPLVVPIVVFAAGLYFVKLVYLPQGTSPELVLVLAHGVMTMPYVLLYIRAAFSQVNWQLERAARNAGASGVRAFADVVLPQIWPALAASGVLAFVLSLDETVISMFVTDGSTRTLPARMFSSISYQLNPLVPVAAAVMLGSMAALGILYLVIRIVANRLKNTQQSHAARATEPENSTREIAISKVVEGS
ncbi:ABC transporter permease [Leucobacter soli]|uniref:ABC transmembrane type-1 domain-containing protein n=1 Tax=Leucobacter soli TaxID=2812850 RepID=A0A916NMF6_9MICO|nr:ABC transporter permease [Leucobacter soli]CAG7605199.1 hypothetical protein LEUCIP111803_00806 [Leucobacter soli]